MSTRRSFVRQLSWATVFTQCGIKIPNAEHLIAEESVIVWGAVRALFPVTGWDKVHMNSGSAGVLPIPVIDHLHQLTLELNSRAPYMAWADWGEIYNSNKERVAKLIGANSHEIQFVRNTTEALNLIVQGVPLQSKDEVIISEHDYPYAHNAWVNRGEQEGFVVRKLEFELPASADELVDVYLKAINKNTKLIHLTHITHRQGHIMPVSRIIKGAHERGVEVLIDGAHVVGQIPVNLEDLECDYFASSLHKWLNAPHGCGLLYVNEDKIEKLGSIISAPIDESGIEKFSHLGTRGWQAEVGLSASLDFHDHLGPKNKYKRLQELKNYWTKQLIEVPKVNWWTDLDETHSCGVVTVGIEGLSGSEILKLMNQEFNIHAKSVGGSWGSAVRISPNIFTSMEELDHVVSAITSIAQRF